ncbi:Capsule synthesis protein CapA domain-containing protein [Plasmodiophora brassicae]
MGGQSAMLRLLITGGDNMFGRAIQLSCWAQSPGDDDVRDSQRAVDYLRACLACEGADDAPLPLSSIREMNRTGAYLWGDYLGLALRPPPDLRLFNLETAVCTTLDNDDVPYFKGINYHLHSDNLRDVLSSYASETHGDAEPSPYVISFANNHTMDFGRKAFDDETMPMMRKHSYNAVGAGETIREAARPVEFVLGGECHVQVFAMGAACSGTSYEWAARPDRSGVFWVPGLTSGASVDRAFDAIHAALGQHPKRGDRSVRIVSIHWGPNWAYRYGPDDGQAYRRQLAHRLIDDAGVDIIYGHSSHHVRGLERYRGKLILYGAGDLVNDYFCFENLGDEPYNKLGALYVVDVDPGSGDLRRVQLIPMFMDRLRLRRLQRGSRIWDARRHRLRPPDPNAVDEFREFVNRLSFLDSSAGNALKFRAADDAHGPTLVYP